MSEGVNQSLPMSFQPSEHESTRTFQGSLLLIPLSVDKPPLHPPKTGATNFLIGFATKHIRHTLRFPISLLVSRPLCWAGKEVSPPHIQLFNFIYPKDASLLRTPYLGEILFKGSLLKAVQEQPISSGNSECRDL